jgi:hypothetical protein
MKDRRRRRTMAFGVGSRWDQRVSVQETTDRNQGDRSILGNTLAMVKANRARSTIELRHTGIAGARKLFTHSIRRDNSGGDGRGVVALHHTEANGVLGRNAKVADSNGGMITIISNTKSGSPATGIKGSDMPKVVKAVGSTGHGATIHVGTSRGGGAKGCFLCTELLVELGPRDFHFANLEVKSIQGTGTRVQSINVGVKKSHIGVRKGSTMDAVEQMGIRRSWTERIVIIIKKVKVEHRIGGRGQTLWINKSTSGKESILHQIFSEVIKINIIKLKQKIGCRMPEIIGGRQL